MLFAEYYGEPFRRDLDAVIAGLPPMHLPEGGDVILQPRILDSQNPAVRSLSDKRRALFGAALFLTVVADQVCYSYYPEQYARFRELTRYPKLKGECFGMCHVHIHPSNALEVGRRSGGEAHGGTETGAALPADVLTVMRAEVETFVEQYLPGVSPSEFWGRIDDEIPEDLRLRVGLATPSR